MCCTSDNADGYILPASNNQPFPLAPACMGSVASACELFQTIYKHNNNSNINNDDKLCLLFKHPDVQFPADQWLILIFSSDFLLEYFQQISKMNGKGERLLININIFSRFFIWIFPADLKEELDKEKESQNAIKIFSSDF